MVKVVITTDFLRYAEVNRKGAMGAFFGHGCFEDPQTWSSS
jgi:hypothetical protein